MKLFERNIFSVLKAGCFLRKCQFNFHLFLFFIFLFFIGCSEQKGTVEDDKIEPAASAQVVLKTQITPFVLAEKSAVKSEYKSQSKMTVPTDLAPQNKWVMFEGPVLENELIAYRFYLDSRHRSDIYGKKTNDLVMDTVGWDYHDIMDWGSDILKVGNSLGIGAPGIWYQDSLYTLSDCAEKNVEVTKSSGEKAEVLFTFKDLKIGEETRTITQRWSLSTGRPHSTVALKVEGAELPEGAYFATGIVKHIPEADSGSESGKFYISTWGKQSYHKQNLGMGIVADTVFSPQVKSHSLSHLVVFENSKAGVEYEFAAAWEADVMGVKSAEAFKKLLLN